MARYVSAAAVAMNPPCIPTRLHISHLTRDYMSRTVRVESMVGAGLDSFPLKFPAPGELWADAGERGNRDRPYANAKHEAEVGAYLAKHAPEMDVALSHEVSKVHA